MQEIDLSQLAYADFVKFFFDREVDYFHKGKGVWQAYRFVKPPARPEFLVSYLTDLCKKLAGIISLFTWPQINQAIWGILHYPAEISALMMKDDIPQFIRKKCIEAMYEIFSEVVQHIENDVPLENCFFMWWHIIGIDFCNSQNHVGESVFYPKTSEAQETHDTILDTLLKILQLDHMRIKLAVMHGLGHLHHPRGPAIVQKFIDKNKEIFFGESLRWLEQCRDGTVI